MFVYGHVQMGIRKVVIMSLFTADQPCRTQSMCILFSISSDFLLPYYRHPMTTQRLNFPDITRQLSLPDTKLLKWSEEDKSVHPEAATLGTDLLCGEGLYKDLQTRYKTGN